MLVDIVDRVLHGADLFRVLVGDLDIEILFQRESAPRSSMKEALGVTSASSTPNCSAMICFTFSVISFVLSPAAIRFLQAQSLQSKRLV